MNPAFRHIIQQQRIQCQVADEREAFAWQQRLSHLYWNEVVPTLEKMFDRLSSEGVHIRIEKLEIDLGVIAPSEVGTVLVQKMVEAIEQALQKQLTSHQEAGIQSIPPTESALDDWLYFLETGHLPWNATQTEIARQKAVLATLAAHAPALARLRQLLQRQPIALERLILQHEVSFLKTLAGIFTGKKQDKLLKISQLLEKNLSNEIRLKFTVTSSSQRFTALFWKSVFELLLVQPSKTSWIAIVTSILESWLSSTDIAVWLEKIAQSTSTKEQTLLAPLLKIKAFSKKAAVPPLEIAAKEVPQTDAPLLEETQLTIQTSSQDATTEIIAEVEQERSIEPIINAPSSATTKTPSEKSEPSIADWLDAESPLIPQTTNQDVTPEIIAEVAQEFTTEQAPTPPFLETPEMLLEKEETLITDLPNRVKPVVELVTANAPSLLDKNAPPEAILPASILKDDSVEISNKLSEQPAAEPTIATIQNQATLPFAEVETSKTSSVPIKINQTQPVGTTYYIRHAGVILLHPFLSTFFRNFNLLEDNQFRDNAARHRGIHLIHYLASKENIIPEYQLLLPKLLCNVPFEMPIDRYIEITDTEQAEAENLLRAAIQHWGALGNTSPDGLREGFLQRDGKLERRTNGWYLQVERKTLDILLDRLPWNLSMLQLPWMSDLLRVEW